VIEGLLCLVLKVLLQFSYHFGVSFFSDGSDRTILKALLQLFLSELLSHVLLVLKVLLVVFDTSWVCITLKVLLQLVLMNHVLCKL